MSSQPTNTTTSEQSAVHSCQFCDILMPFNSKIFITQYSPKKADTHL